MLHWLIFFTLMDHKSWSVNADLQIFFTTKKQNDNVSVLYAACLGLSLFSYHATE